MQVNKSAGEWAPCVSNGPIYAFNSRVIKDDFNRVYTVNTFRMLLLSGDQISDQFKYSVKNLDIMKLRVKNSQNTLLI